MAAIALLIFFNLSYILLLLVWGNHFILAILTKIGRFVDGKSKKKKTKKSKKIALKYKSSNKINLGLTKSR